MPKINPERLLADLRRFAEFGRYKTGVHRPTYTAQDMASRHWLAGQFESAGLAAHIDGVGNVFGRQSSPNPALLVGSHAESQNYAGWLDGAMGVIFALELVRAFRESPDCADLPVEPVAWADEETHFISLLGSRSFIGELNDGDLDAATNKYTGQPLREALRDAGLDETRRALIDPGRYLGYLEAHIEQGDSLEATGNRIGVVTSIVGIWQYRIAFSGVQNHAGTTRMAIRRDAGVAAVRLCGLIADSFPEIAGERSVWTTGKIDLLPGAASIIPGEAEVLFQFRDEDEAVLQRLHDRLVELVAQVEKDTGCVAKLTQTDRGSPLRMRPDFQDALMAAAQHHAPETSIRMPSGASHDAQIIGRRIPAGMLFVPSIGGISHHWSENTKNEDLVLGCQVFADGAERILRADRQRRH